MKPSPEVVRVMTPFPYTIEISASIQAAKEKLEEHNIMCLPVTRNGELVGVLTQQNVELALAIGAYPPAQPAITVAELCRKQPYIVETTEKLVTVVSHMLNSQVHAALVVKHGRLVGVFTALDAYNVLLRSLLGKSLEGDPPDILA